MLKLVTFHCQIANKQFCHSFEDPSSSEEGKIIIIIITV